MCQTRKAILHHKFIIGFIEAVPKNDHFLSRLYLPPSSSLTFSQNTVFTSSCQEKLKKVNNFTKTGNIYMKTRTQIAFGSYQWMLIYVGREKNETQDAFVTTLSNGGA